MKVLLCASEGSPYIKTGGLADVIGALPKALKEAGVDVRVILPYYQKIKQKGIGEYLGYAYVRIGDSNEYAGIMHAKTEDGIDYYFVDSNRYFDRPNPYSYGDDGIRFAFFNFAVLEALRVINFYPDVIHVNDWQTGLIPYILKTNYQDDERYKYIKTLYSIHNIQYQGQFGLDVFNDLHIPYSLSLEYNFGINYMKTAIMEADIVTTVSKTYKDEVLTYLYGYGLQDVLKMRYNDFYGILNGIDVLAFDPKTDSFIYHNYSQKDYKKGKDINKKALLEEFGLDSEEDVPLFGLVSRLADQKGIDLLIPIMDEIIHNTNAKFILMGSGDHGLEEFFRSLESRYPSRFKSYVGYNEAVAQKIYAGSDLFLMPSKFEPCGLGQMIAMRYGTLPLVRETGGLKDTVIPYNKYTKEGCGFSFTNFNPEDLKNVMYLAIDVYNNNRDDFNLLIESAMKQDFSWDASAQEYIKLYEKLK